VTITNPSGGDSVSKHVDIKAAAEDTDGNPGSDSMTVSTPGKGNNGKGASK
jgi:hypothetical protein